MSGVEAPAIFEKAGPRGICEGKAAKVADRSEGECLKHGPSGSEHAAISRRSQVVTSFVRAHNERGHPKQIRVDIRTAIVTADG